MTARPHKRPFRAPEEYQAYFKEAGLLFNIPSLLLEAVSWQESDHIPNKVSNKDCMGLMQLSKDVCRQVGVMNPFDPRQNIMGGAKYLLWIKGFLKQKNLPNNWPTVLAGYFSGVGNVVKARGIPKTSICQKYVKQIPVMWEWLKEHE